MGMRRRAREAALQILYCMDLAEVTVEEAERNHWAHLASSVEGKDFAGELVRGWSARSAEIDEAIRRVSENWRIERMPRVDRNILRIGAYELLYVKEVPSRVTINEAVELAKRYAGEGSAGFVNGVLDRIATDNGKT